MMMYTCTHCGIVKTTLYRYSKHLRLFHEKFAHFYVTCNIEGCNDTFHKVRNFVRHVAAKHKNVQTAESESVIDASDVESLDNVAIITTEEGCAHACTTEILDDQKCTLASLDQTVSDLEKHMAFSILKLREKHILPVCVQQDIIDEMQLLVSQLHDTYKSVFLTVCEEQSITSPSAGMGHIFLNETSMFDDIFQHINTDYKLNRFICDNFQFAKPIEIVFEPRRPGNSPSFHYIPVSSVLKLMLSNVDVRQQIQSGKTVFEDAYHMASYVDGSIYANHPFFSDHPDAIRLHFYLDEFEVCNPIGSKRGKHKVLAVYYFVGNMDCKYWSEMKYIHLCVLVRYQHLRQFDPFLVQLLKPLIDELETLASEGIDVIADGVTYNFRAGLATVSGDNLSAHDLGGFQRHFNADLSVLHG
jgi:hypothetical protein